MTDTKESSLMVREMCLILKYFSRGGIPKRHFQGYGNK